MPLPGGSSACKRAYHPGRSSWMLPLAYRPSSKALPATRNRVDLSRGHRPRPLSQLAVPERSSVWASTCHKFDKKSLIAVQTQPRFSSKIPLWLHPLIGRNVTELRGLAACARRSAMAKGTSSSSVPCPMKMGQVTRQTLLRLSKRSLMKRRTTHLGTHGSMAWACSGMFVNAPSTIKPATCLRAARSMATAAPRDQPATTIWVGWARRVAVR